MIRKRARRASCLLRPSTVSVAETSQRLVANGGDRSQHREPNPHLQRHCTVHGSMCAHPITPYKRHNRRSDPMQWTDPREKRILAINRIAAGSPESLGLTFCSGLPQALHRKRPCDPGYRKFRPSDGGRTVQRKTLTPHILYGCIYCLLSVQHH